MKYFLVLLLAVAAHAADFRGYVVHVVDGDTVDVSSDAGKVRVRLWGIDAPERKQPYGSQATHALREFVTGKPVRVVDKGREKYGRMLAELWLDKASVNAWMVTMGWAWGYERSYHKLYLFLEQTARNDRRGLWAGREAMPPWEFRKR